MSAVSSERKEEQTSLPPMEKRLIAEIAALKQELNEARAKVEKWQEKVLAQGNDKMFELAKSQLGFAQDYFKEQREILKQKEDQLHAIRAQIMASARVAVGAVSSSSGVASGMCYVLVGVSSLFCLWSCC